MNEIVNTFLLMGDKFMPEMHLKQLVFTYSTCGPFTKNKKKLKSLCNHWANIIKGISIHYVQSIFFSKYACVILIKDKKRTSIANAFQKIILKGRKPNKIWVDQGSEFIIIILKIFWK